MPATSSTDGVTVDYLRLGGPDAGPRLLFVHATGFCATVWRPMAQVLSERYDCWAVDIRGHGRSSTPPATFDWSGTADDVLAVLDDLGGDGPWLGVGHSMGGASRSNRCSSARCTRVPLVAAGEGDSGRRSMAEYRNARAQSLNVDTLEGERDVGSGKLMW